MKVSFVGSGNVATQMAIAFKKAGYVLAEIWSKHPENAEILAKTVDANVVTDLKTMAPADLYIIAIKDDEIEQALTQLTVGDGTVVHTSGATALSVFEGKFKNFGVFYPLQTFSKLKNVDFSQVPLCIEANSEATTDKLVLIAENLSEKVYKVGSKARQTLHLAAVFACNFTNHLYTLGGELLAEQGLDFELLRPLIKETADKVLNNLPQQVQTGPAVRADEQTMARHIAMLDKHPQLRDIYKILSESIKKANAG